MDVKKSQPKKIIEWVPKASVQGVQTNEKAVEKGMLGKFKVNWKVLEDDKTQQYTKQERANPGFQAKISVFFQKYFKYSKSLTEKTRDEIVLELATEAYKKDKSKSKSDLALIFKKELEGKSASSLLKIDKRAFVEAWRNALVNHNKDMVESAIFSLKAKYPDEMKEAIPIDRDSFTKPTESKKSKETEESEELTVFEKFGGRNHIMTHQEMENALLDYMKEKGNLAKNKFSTIKDKQEQEKKVIDGLTKEYLNRKMAIQSGGKSEEVPVYVPAEMTESIIDIWQKQQGYKKDVSEEGNKQRVEDFILKVHETTQKAALKVFYENPRGKAESASSYKNRLSLVIEKTIGGNEVATRLCMCYLQPIIDREKSNDAAKVSKMLDEAKQGKREFVDDYIRRVSQEIKKQLDPDTYKDVAVNMLIEFTAKKRAEYAVKFVVDDFEKNNPDFKKFTPEQKNQFKSSLQSFLQPWLSDIREPMNMDQVKRWAQGTIKIVQEKKQ